MAILRQAAHHLIYRRSHHASSPRRSLADLLLQGRLVEIGGYSALMPLDQPNRLAEEISGFAAGLWREASALGARTGLERRLSEQGPSLLRPGLGECVEPGHRRGSKIAQLGGRVRCVYAIT